MATHTGSTAGLVAGGVPAGAPAAPDGEGQFFGVSDDYFRVGQVDTFDNPMRRVAPGVIVGGQKAVQRPQYNKAWLEAQMANMAPEDVWVYQQKMARAGFIGPKTRVAPGQWDRSTRNAIREVLELANIYTVDIDTALNMAMESGSGALGADGLGGGGLGEEAPFSGKKNRTDTTVNLSNPQEARTRIRRALRSELGRAPRKDEMSAFIAALSSSEQSNPVVDQSTATYVDGEVTATNSIQSGGVDPEAFTEEYVLNDPKLNAERGSFMRDTDYYDAAMSVLGEGGGRL